MLARHIIVAEIVIVVLLVATLLGNMFSQSEAQNAVHNSENIPPQIWQTYKSKTLPQGAKRCQNSWTKHQNYQYTFMDDAEITDFMVKHMPASISAVFENVPLGVMKADIWRYCILFKRGGIYSDIDSVAVRSISRWGIRPVDRIIIGLENDEHFCQWTIVSEAGHPILKTVIDLIAEEAKTLSTTISKNEHFVHATTGPGIWTRAVNKTLGFPESQHAKTTYSKYNDPNYSYLFKELGLRLEPVLFFSGKNTRNLYGSKKFGDGYVKWVEEANSLKKKIS